MKLITPFFILHRAYCIGNKPRLVKTPVVENDFGRSSGGSSVRCRSTVIFFVVCKSPD